MITPENLSEILNMLTEIEIKTAFERNEDYVLLSLAICNAGGYASLDCLPYHEETESEANASGNLFCDKDTLLQLFKDSNSINPFLMELI